MPALPPWVDSVDEARRVYVWRRECFLADRFTWEQAVKLADQGADHHEAESLLERGASHELVCELLLK